MAIVSMENVDDLLVSQITGTPVPDKPIEQEQSVSHETSEVKSLSSSANPQNTQNTQNEYGDAQTNDAQKTESVPQNTQNEESDEYGLNAESESSNKTYTKSEMDEYANRLIRERLARMERNSGQQFTQQQVQQQAQQVQQNFQYDENSNLDWQQQLKQFVKQTNAELAQEQAYQAAQLKEQALQQAFEAKFHQSKAKFHDFNDVVGSQPITDAMVMGARGINDPAAFFYAAAKRAPEELAKIAANPDPYAQAAAIGRLDEKLRKQASRVSNAPRPVSKTQSDLTIEQPAAKGEPTLDDLLVEDQRRRQAMLMQRRR